MMLIKDLPRVVYDVKNDVQIMYEGVFHLVISPSTLDYYLDKTKKCYLSPDPSGSKFILSEHYELRKKFRIQKER